MCRGLLPHSGDQTQVIILVAAEPSDWSFEGGAEVWSALPDPFEGWDDKRVLP